MSALDPGSDIYVVARLTLRRFLLSPLVRPVAVVVPGVLSQATTKMLWVPITFATRQYSHRPHT
jgi:hypothetical protein